MKAEVEKELRVRLELDEDETRWLRGYLQNYVGEGEESERDEGMRRVLFEHLSEALVESGRPL